MVKNQAERDNILIIIAIFALIFVNAFKDYRLLPDISGYVPAFKYIAKENSNFLDATRYYKMQWGYYALNKFIGFFLPMYIFLWVLWKRLYVFLILFYLKGIQKVLLFLQYYI